MISDLITILLVLGLIGAILFASWIIDILAQSERHRRDTETHDETHDEKELGLYDETTTNGRP